MDHDALFDRLSELTRGHAHVRRSECLLACEGSNVVVVSPGRVGRLHGGRAVWFHHVLTIRVVAAIAQWVRDGGPGVAEPPLEARQNA